MQTCSLAPFIVMVSYSKKCIIFINGHVYVTITFCYAREVISGVVDALDTCLTVTSCIHYRRIGV